MLKKSLMIALAILMFPVLAHAQYSNILNPKQEAPAADSQSDDQTDQEPRKGVQRNMPVPGAQADEDGSAPAMTGERSADFSIPDDGEDLPTPPEDDMAIDNLGASLTGDTFIELSSVYQDLLVRPNATFDVVLLTEDGRSWYHDDHDNQIVELIDDRTDGNLTIYSFRTVQEGFQRLYFDYVDNTDGKVNVVESRILDLSVGTKSAKDQ